MILALDRVAEVEAWLRVWFRGFVVTRFRAFVVSRFRGFVVSWFVVRGSWFALLPCSLTI